VNLVLAQNGSDIQVGHHLGAVSASYDRQTSGDLICGSLGRGNDGIGRRSEDDPNLVVIGVNQSHALTSTHTRSGRYDPNGETFVTATLNSGRNSGGFRTEPGEHLVATAGVRRLTPLECERLQGFPDGWTCLCGEGHRGSQFCRCSDTPRYRALGNAVSVPVAQWIAQRILTAGDGPLTRSGVREEGHAVPDGL